MALVSSITPSTSLYPSAASIHARTTSDPSSPSVLVRALPTPPPTSTSSSSRSMHASPVKSASGLPQLGQQAGSSRSGTSRTGGGGESYNSQHAPRQGSSTPGYATTSAGGGGGGATSSSSAGGVGSSPSSSSVRLPSPLPPSRSASTPPLAFQSTSSSSSSSPNRPTATPLPNQQNASYHHQHSSSSSSLPRINPAQYQQQQQQNYMSQPQVAHPSFVGQSFSPFAPPHAFAHPAFPFVPSPHPNNNSNNYVSYSPNGQMTPGGTAEQQKRMQAFQQAQWAAAAGQMELFRNQQTTYQNQNQSQNGQDGRRRTASGPAANHSPSYYTTPLPYPPSPSPSQYGLPSSGSTPSFPAGAMLPHFAANHGYPTPPGSTEGVVRGGESGGSSSGGSREGGYHPYRRDQHHHHQASKSSSSESGTRSSSTPRSHSTTPSKSSMSSRVAVPKITAPSPQQPQQNRTTHSRTESSQSSQAYPSQSIPRSHTSTPSITSVRSLTLPSSSSTSQLPSPAYASRPRTQSANSSSSSLHRQQYEQSQPAAPLPRQASFESARSSTPHAQNRPRPSPLGGVHQPLPVDSDEDSDDGAGSDGTAEATATVNSASLAAAQVSRSPTMNSMATIKTSAPPPVAVVEKGKEKEKKGMASRFKKAFGGGGSSSNSSSATTLTERELDGRGPVQLNGGFRPRHDSVSSSETSTNPRTPPSAHTSQPSIASMASSSSRTINGDADSTRKAPSSRFRLLNSKLNSSTDNISISSTVSSASVMIRKLGQMGKLARRNSLMGLTKAFKKDKNKDGEEEDPLKTPGKKDKKNKSGASLASVSHATAEVESSPHQPGMSPAAALAKRQQAHYAEQEAAEAKAREEAAKLGPPSMHSHGRTDSDGASVKSGKSGKWGIGRSKTTDDADQGRQKALEKEKDKLKSRNQKGSKGGFRLGFGGSKTDLHSDAGSIIRNDDASSIAGTERGGGSALGLYRDGDTTPRQSLEILAPPQSYATYGQETVRRDSSSDYEPSLYRQGAVPPSQNPRSVKGILKGAGTYSQDHYARPRPGFHRNRASSFDAPQQQGRPGSPGGAALVNVIPSQAQVDGVAPSSTSARTDTQPPTSTERIHDSAIARVEGGGGGSVYGNPSMNASAPVLTQFAAQTAIRSNSAPGAGTRRIAFAANLSVHTTWPAAIYDRRAEPATCNRLTPTLAQQIKEELNSFKMEEMDVHPDSRKLTHFFV